MTSEDLVDDDADLPNLLSAVDNRAAQELRLTKNLWKLNYHEASIFIEEGLNNDKFENHPKNQRQSTSSAQKKPIRTYTDLVGQQNNCLVDEEAPLNMNQQIKSSVDKLDVQIQQTKITFKEDYNSTGANHQQDTNELIPLAPKLNLSKPMIESVMAVEPLLSDMHRHKTNPFARRKLLGGQYTTIETYILVHNKYFYQLDLLASIVLLLLAIVEPPAVTGYSLAPSLHASIEMFALAIVGIELLLKFRWMGPKQFFRHGRTVTKLVVLLTMITEAIVIFMRYSTHARYSRALRPIFLIDNHYCHGIRRAIRQIFQSLPPILDMFTLMMFFMFIFSIFGFYFLANDGPYFANMPSTVGNLLVLVTTANLPDIMMPSYGRSRWSSLFFVLFLIVHLYLLTNLTMAAVYESFTRKEKEKFHKLLLHRRKACQQAFKLLVSRRVPHRIQFKQFMGFMRFLNPHCTSFDAFLVFKALDTDNSGQLSLQEFYQIYDFIDLKWRLKYPHINWYDNCKCIPQFIKYQLDNIRHVVEHRYFSWATNIIIAISALLQFIEASTLSGVSRTTTTTTTTSTSSPIIVNLNDQQQQNNNNESVATTSSITLIQQVEITPDFVSTSIIIGIYSAEIILRACALGCQEYLRNYWNRFDAIVLTISLAGLFTGYAPGHHHLGWLIVLRVIRLMRLFEFKRRYKDIWQTLTYILMKRFVSMTCVIMIMYYFFGIIGMELFSQYDLRNCCKNTSLESQFKYEVGPQHSQDYPSYYLNDFGDVVASYLTLFSMSSSTYWLVTMNAYAIVAGSNLIRIYFAIYYLCSIIVTNIVIAFILESFLFRIHYRRKLGEACDDANLFTVDVYLSKQEMEYANRTLDRKNKNLHYIKKSFITKTNHHNDHIRNKPASTKQQQQPPTIKVTTIDNQHYDGYQLQQQALDKSEKQHVNNNNKLETIKQKQQTATMGSNNSNNIIKQQRNRAPSLTSSNQLNASYVSTSTLTNRSNDYCSTTSASSSSTTPATPNGNHANVTSSSSSSSSASSSSSNFIISNCQQQLKQQQQDVVVKTNVCRLIRDSEKLRQSNDPDGSMLMYQAEQTRNKFSFTMKMYADEVKEWLEEADRADREELARQRLLNMADIHSHFTSRRTYSCSY